MGKSSFWEGRITPVVTIEIWEGFWYSKTKIWLVEIPAACMHELFTFHAIPFPSLPLEKLSGNKYGL
jgi:hypothetical protein